MGRRAATRGDRLLAAGLLLLASAAAARPARAQAPPVLAIEVPGRCPSEARLRRALQAAFRLAAPSAAGAPASAWRLRVRERRDGSLSLALLAPGGQRSASRTLKSRDCDARADALAIILQAHFVQLALPRALDPRVAPAPRAPASRPTPRAATRQPAPARSTRDTSPPPPKKPAPRGRRSRRWLAVGLAGGVSARLAPAPAAGAAGQLDVAIAPLRVPLGLRLVALVTQPTTQSTALDRTEIRRVALRLELAWRARLARWWLQPALGAGLGLLWVTANGLDGAPTTLRARPLVAAALAAGLRLARSLSLRAELAASVYLRADRYVVAPDGEVARSARATLMFSLGLQVDAFW